MFSKQLVKPIQLVKMIHRCQCCRRHSISYFSNLHREHVENFMNKCSLSVKLAKEPSHLTFRKFRKDPISLQEQFGNNSEKLMMNDSQFVQVMHYMCSPEEYIRVLEGQIDILKLSREDIKKLPTGEWSIKNPGDPSSYLYLTEDGVKSFPNDQV